MACVGYDALTDLPSPNLTALLCPQVEDLLPISAPAWPHLRELTLCDLGLDVFPEGLARVLGSLSYLDLAENDFVRLPPALKLLSNLQYLEISKNESLSMEEEDVDSLATLPCLHTCRLSKQDPESDFNWTDSSVVALVAISRRLPLLKLVLL